VERSGLVIFDCDGVLVDSEAISSRVMTDAINAVGWQISYDEVRARFQGESLAAMSAAVERVIGRPVGPAWLDAFERRRSEAFRAGLTEVRGASAAVDEIRRVGYDVCVASQARVEKTRLTLGLTGLLDRFDAGRLFSSSMVARGKPAPDLFLHAAHACGRPPEACVVVEDGLRGVVAATAAGMRVLAYGAGGDAAALARAGAEVFLDMRELPGRLARAEPRRA
jgi:beta-phosphoglucomutase-like phosphatase (HAD superfamily)